MHKPYPVETVEITTSTQGVNKSEVAQPVTKNNPKTISKTTDNKSSVGKHVRQKINEANTKASNPNRQDHGHKPTKLKKRVRKQKPSPKKHTKRQPIRYTKVPRRKPLPLYKKIENTIEHLLKMDGIKSTIFNIGLS